MTPWVLVDVSFIAYRALHSVGNLEFDDVPTGVIFGFFTQLRQICSDPRIRSSKIAIFCDSRTSKRAKIYPNYKLRRQTERPPEEVARIHCMRDQVDELTHRVLPAVGFTIYHQEGLESDDLIALASRELSKQQKPGDHRGRVVSRQGVMVTADGDLYQCITPSVHWFDPQRGLYHNPSTFLEAKGIECSKWGEVKALSGCHSDNVEGIRGVGEKTAIRYLNGDLPPKHKIHQAIVSGAGRATAQRNRELVVLPHKDTTPFELKDPKYDTDAFFDECKRFGLASIIEEKKAWISFLHGTPFKMRKRGEL